MAAKTNTYRVTIRAAQEIVFKYVSDLTRHPEWSGGRLRVEARSPGPVTAGSQFESWGDLPQQKDRHNDLRVTLYQPPGLFTFIAKDPDFGEVEHAFTFESKAQGTEVVRTVTTSVPVLMALLSRFFLHPLIGKPMMDKSMRRLKERLESASTRQES